MKNRAFWFLFIVSLILLAKVVKDAFAEDRFYSASMFKKTSSQPNLFRAREENLRNHLNSLNQILHTEASLPRP